jgi:hypothetical protein
LNSQYKDLAVLILKQAKSEKYHLASLIAHIVTVLTTRNTILTSNDTTLASTSSPGALIC